MEKAEDYLYELGIRQCRVRDHDDTVRIEIIEEDKDIITENRNNIRHYFREIGFKSIIFKCKKI